MIELIAVMVVVAILAASAIPVWTSMTSRRAAVAERLLQRDLEFARQWAVATGAPAWLHIDLANQEWEIVIESIDSPGLANATPFTDPATGDAHHQDLDEGDFLDVRLAEVSLAGREWIGFDWLGSPLTAEETSPDVFNVTDLGEIGSITFESGHQVQIQPVTGAVSTAGGGS